MRGFIISMVLLVLLAVFVGWSLTTVNAMSKELEEKTKEAQNAVLEEDMQKADKLVGELYSLWQKKEHILCALINHDEVDTIKISVAKSLGYSKTYQKTDLLGELSALCELFAHLREAQRLSLENIF